MKGLARRGENYSRTLDNDIQHAALETQAFLVFEILKSHYSHEWMKETVSL